jgi:hypothetical protein
MAFPRDLENVSSFLEAHLSARDSPSNQDACPSNILASISVDLGGSYCRNYGKLRIKHTGNQLMPFMDMLNTVTKAAYGYDVQAAFDEMPHSTLTGILPSGFWRSIFGHFNSPAALALGYEQGQMLRSDCVGKRLMRCILLPSLRWTKMPLKIISKILWFSWLL